MPVVEVVFYQDDDQSVPVNDWLDEIPAQARDRCLARLVLLHQHGHELRRPVAEYIEGTDLYELRVKFYRTNYRILYFFHGRTAAIVNHGCDKEKKLSPGDIRIAAERMGKFIADPERHSFGGEE